ncbi:MAG: EboA domain-containing protein [Nocardioidaceae bacterium]
MTGLATELFPALGPALSDAAHDRLVALAEEVIADPTRIRVHHPAAARVVGRGPLDPSDPTGLLGPTLDDAVRVVLVVALARALTDDRAALVCEVGDLYRYGDGDEKRAVLRALPRLDIGGGGLPLVSDALRANDVRLVAAALGPYAAWHLPDEPWRQGVLKCLFVGVPLEAVAGLAERADAGLARMVADYCHERVAAGRDVPVDVWLVLDRHPRVVDESPLRGELTSSYADRRAAAERFFHGRESAASRADHRSTKEA